MHYPASLVGTILRFFYDEKLGPTFIKGKWIASHVSLISARLWKAPNLRFLHSLSVNTK